MKTYLAVSFAMMTGIAIGGFAVQGLQAQGKAPVFLVSEIDVTNPEAYGKEFAPKAQETIRSSGRKLAAASPDSTSASRWRQVAVEYDQLAESMEASDLPPPVQRASMQQQPMQQQQSKAEDEK